MKMKESAEKLMLDKAVDYVVKDPRARLPKLLNKVEMLDRKHLYQRTYDNLHRSFADPEDNWNRFLCDLASQSDPGILKKLLFNIVINSGMAGYPIQIAAKEKHRCNIPWAILMDPTSACNLRCTGCWAAEYGQQNNLSYEVMDRVIREGKELGVYIYIFSGGEPLVKKDLVLQLCENHPDCIFLAFTNGTLVDEKFADDLLRVGNFMLAFSIEGFEAETDMRRGKGTYQKVVAAMSLLKEKRIPFGFSTCYHAQNTQVVGSDEYIDLMVELGCRFGWYFTYMPVGSDAVPELMVSPEQRAYMYDRMQYFRKNKPIFALDFWNDGSYVGGCIAGGRSYLHINAAGDVEPCAFIHYSNVNINDCSLLDALKSPLFMAYREHQPFNDNHLRPCPLLDNPDMLVEMVRRSGAKSTDMVSPEDVEDLANKCRNAAKCWGTTADILWEDYLLQQEKRYSERFRTVIK
ncbi:radical SAM protein [Gehongia tenuis]|uniref:Radical SAM protein n=1 Tax=Gehongia tenuis TaxID=2763655 RepID=A0A926D699_9FIRM|nr:radical SAM protein [Gehongia tenuis]MBC8532031.1 radical SAM protein [Gehongia tenuis]